MTRPTTTGRPLYRKAALARLDASEPLDKPVDFTRPRLAMGLLAVALLSAGIGMLAAGGAFRPWLTP